MNLRNVIISVSLFFIAIQVGAQTLSLKTRTEAGLVKKCSKAVRPATETPDHRNLQPMQYNKVRSITVIPTSLAQEMTPTEMQRIHTKKEGYCDIGFHFGVFYNNENVDSSFTIYSLRETQFQGDYWVKGASQPVVIDGSVRQISNRTNGIANSIGIVVPETASVGAIKALQSIVTSIVTQGQFAYLQDIQLVVGTENEAWAKAVKDIKKETF